MSSIVIIKIGSQIFLDENGKFDSTVIQNIACDIAKLRPLGYQFIIVSSGACALGRSVLVSSNSSTPLGNQITASVGQPLLMRAYEEIFEKYDITVAQALLTRFDFGTKSTYNSIYAVLARELELGILPIINENDVVANEEIIFSDNDQLAAFVAMMLSATKLILLSNIEGLYTASPDEGGTVVRVVDQIDDKIFEYVSAKKSHAGRGGMWSKLLSAQVATNTGIDVVIAPGKQDHIISDILKGKSVGTLFRGQENSSKKSRTETWIHSGAIVKGTIIVNTCLEKLLQDRKRISILEIGIVESRGVFESGDIIEVANIDGKVYGKGKAKISSKELGQYTPEERSKVVVHANYFVYT